MSFGRAIPHYSHTTDGTDDAEKFYTPELVECCALALEEAHKVPWGGARGRQNTNPFWWKLQALRAFTGEQPCWLCNTVAIAVARASGWARRNDG